MECHGCKKEITKDEFKKVGVWDFCNTCFDNLMEKAENKASQKQDIPNDEQSESSPSKDFKPQSSKKKCTVCEMPIVDNDITKIGSLNVCPTCYQELIARPEPVKIKIDVPDEEDTLDEEQEDIKSNYQDMAECYECNRTIHRIGGKEFDGNLYCPDCFYKNEFHQSR